MTATLLLLAVLALSGLPRPASAESGLQVSQLDLSSALTTRLAYVLSGDAKVDEATKQGLDSLSAALASRTSLSPGDPAAVDPAKDELAFYAMLYWPVVASAPKPSAAAAAKIAAFMRQGGTIVFDTRDALLARPNGSPTPETAWLAAVVQVKPVKPAPDTLLQSGAPDGPAPYTCTNDPAGMLTPGNDPSNGITRDVPLMLHPLLT